MMVICLFCGTAREYRPSRARTLKTGYCIHCVQKLKGTHRKVRCAWCGRELLRKPSQVIRWRRFFCNRAEKGLWVSATQRRGPSDRDKAIRKVRCAWCGRELLRKRSQVIRWRRFFCNRAEKGLWVSATQRRGPSDRDKAILELRKTGLTLREIGARVGLSHERVRELLRSSEDA